MRKKFLFGFLTVGLFFAAAEGLLRLVGFHYQPRVESMKFTFPLEHYDVQNLSQDELASLLEKGVPVMQRDPVLFWKPVAGWLGHNSRGIHGPEFTVPKPEGKFRVVCLGDSCTHFGPDSYPSHLQEELRSRYGPRVEVLNAGVAGCSSHQGLVRLKHEVPEWQPDVVTVYFGWNDHWLSRGVADRFQNPRWSAMSDLLSRYRVYQLLLSVRDLAATSSRPPYRVPLTDYEHNLVQFKQSCDALGVRLIFITAPQALDRGVPEYLTRIGEVDDPSGLVALHAQYNDTVRKVASELSVPLVDLDREFAANAKDLLFIEDHIHLSREGRMLAGRLIAVRIEELGCMDGNDATCAEGGDTAATAPESCPNSSRPEP